MANWTTWTEADDAELRGDMFTVSDEIMGMPTGLPRRLDGKEYTGPEDVAGSAPETDA